MKNIFYILKNDVMKLIRNPASLIVIAALLVLPSLYAWFNIWASWDPYGNTEDIKIAVASNDKGAEIQGKEVNVGDEVLTSLSDNDELGWRLMDEDQAVTGTKHGDYYAAIVIPENFSEDLASVLDETIEKPHMDYYINEKINAIAPKVTSKGASAIVDNIKENFVEETNKTVLTVFDDIGVELDENYVDIQKVRDAIFQLEEDMPNIYAAIQQADDDIELAEIATDRIDQSLDRADELADRASGLNNDLVQRLDDSEDTANDAIFTITKHLQNAQKSVQEVPNLTDRIADKEEDMVHLISNLNGKQNDLDAASNRLQKVIDVLDEQDKNLASSTTIEDLQRTLNGNKDKLITLKREMQALIDELENGQPLDEDIATDISNRLQNTVSNLNEVFADAKAINLERDDLASLTDINENDLDDRLKRLQNVNENPTITLETLKQAIQRIDKMIEAIDELTGSLENVQDVIDSASISDEVQGVRDIQDRLQETKSSFDTIITRLEDAEATGEEALQRIDSQAARMDDSLQDMIDFVNGDLKQRYTRAIRDAKSALGTVTNVLDEVNRKVPKAREVLSKVDDELAGGQEKLDLLNEKFPEASDAITKAADKIRSLEKEGDLDELIDFLRNDPQRISDFVATPVELAEKPLYPVPNYGSAMNPFYTTLSLWVGGLLLVSSLRVDRIDKLQFPSFAVYSSRLIIFGGIGIIQGIIDALGNLFILNAYVAHPFYYTLFVMLIGLVFVTMVYTLVSVFGNVGKVLAIILLVMQIGGSGGTYPIQMAPAFFQKIHSFLPFTHGIELLREAVGGIIWEVAWSKIIYLLLYFIGSIIFGIAFKKFFNKSSDTFMKKAEKSDFIL